MDVDTAKSAMGVTWVCQRGGGMIAGVGLICVMGGEAVYSCNGVDAACLSGGERCFSNIARW